MSILHNPPIAYLAAILIGGDCVSRPWPSRPDQEIRNIQRKIQKPKGNQEERGKKKHTLLSGARGEIAKAFRFQVTKELAKVNFVDYNSIRKPFRWDQEKRRKGKRS